LKTNKVQQEINIRLRSGDHQAFVEIYDANAKVLYHFVKKYIQNNAVIDDIIHDSFLLLWKSRDRIKVAHPVSHYLFRITRNQVFKELKKQIRTAEVFPLSTTPLFDEACKSYTAEESLIDKEYDSIYELAINRLPPQRKRIFKMSREEGLSYKEIAGDLEISSQTVKEHMSLAMKSIKDYIAKEHHILLKSVVLYFSFSSAIWKIITLL